MWKGSPLEGCMGVAVGVQRPTGLVQGPTRAAGQHLHKCSTTITQELPGPSWPLSQEACLETALHLPLIVQGAVWV